MAHGVQASVQIGVPKSQPVPSQNQENWTMENRNARPIVLLVLVCISLLLVSNGQDDKKQSEAYSAVAMGTGGSVGAKSIQFDFRITSFTTDEELDNFAVLLKEKGPDALRSALEKEDKGRVNPTGRIGNQIAVARKRQQGTDTIITIVTARVMSFTELYRSGRSTDYPFGYLQVKLNDKNEGTGQIMAAAKIKFNKKSGHYEVESYGNQYIKAVNVRPWK